MTTHFDENSMQMEVVVVLLRNVQKEEQIYQKLDFINTKIEAGGASGSLAEWGQFTSFPQFDASHMTW